MTPSIFLSHTLTDKPFARRLHSDLQRVGVRVWLDEAELKIGDSLIEKIQNAIDECEYLGVILSPESVESNWVKKEVMTALYDEISGRRLTVLPIMYRSCELPAFLREKLYADFTTKDGYSFAIRQLLDRLGVETTPYFVTEEDLQFLLDRLPTPARRGMFSNYGDEVDYVTANSLDLAGLEALTPWPKRKLYSAIRELLKDSRVEVFLFRGVADGGHPHIPKGTTLMIPFIFKGLFSPSLRPNPQELADLFRNLEKG